MDFFGGDDDGWAIEVPSADIQLTTMLGAGSFGRVYKGAPPAPPLTRLAAYACRRHACH
jgi:hypothetical protein